MYSFVNDYSEGAHPKVLELLIKSNLEQNIGYGLDIHSDKAKQLIKKHIGNQKADIHFIPAGTQTNLLVISSFLRPHQCVIAADTGHINVHETGAVEATGHKVVTMPAKEGKLSEEAILAAIKYHTDEHMVKPGMVYISNSTELGAIYSKNEMEGLHQVCKEHGLLLFLDGARLGTALTSKDNDLSLEDIARLTDVFYIGGTKNGALLGEALVICKEELKEDFRYLVKQRGAMMAKGFVLGIQFEALFQDDLFYHLAKHANIMAEQLVRAFDECGYQFYVRPYTNQLFPVVPDCILKEMGKEFGYQLQLKLNEEESVIRLVTSWATTQESVDQLIYFLKEHRLNR